MENLLLMDTSIVQRVEYDGGKEMIIAVVKRVLSRGCQPRVDRMESVSRVERDN